MLEAPEMRTEQCDSGVDLQKKKKKGRFLRVRKINKINFWQVVVIFSQQKNVENSVRSTLNLGSKLRNKGLIACVSSQSQHLVPVVFVRVWYRILSFDCNSRFHLCMLWVALVSCMQMHSLGRTGYAFGKSYGLRLDTEEQAFS